MATIHCEYCGAIQDDPDVRRIPNRWVGYYEECDCEECGRTFEPDPDPGYDRWIV